MAAHERTGRAVAIVGGAALAVWLLTRGKGTSVPGPGTNQNGERSAARVAVWVRADRIEVDGVATELATVIDRARAAGAAEVRATGDAITGVVWDVLRALHGAGVTIYTTPDLSSVVPAGVLP